MFWKPEDFLDRLLRSHHGEVANPVRDVDQPDHEDRHREGALHDKQRGGGGIQHIDVQFAVFRQRVMGPLEHRQGAGQKQQGHQRQRQRLDEEHKTDAGARIPEFISRLISRGLCLIDRFIRRFVR